MIEADYRHHTVPRRFDPPGAMHYPGFPEEPDDDDVAAEETRFILAALRHAFPSWTITCSLQLQAWIARTGEKTICQNSAVLLCAALTLIERRQPPSRQR